MKNEADFKKAFKQSVRRHRGHSISLAAPMLAGIPDLYVVIPNYIPVLLEAKWLGEIKRDKFFRKIPFTEMQINWIAECHSVAPYSAMGLIGFMYQKKIYAALVAHGTPLFYTFDNTFLTECSHVEYTTTQGGVKLFDIPLLFHGVPIPRIQTKVSNRIINPDGTLTREQEEIVALQN